MSGKLQYLQLRKLDAHLARIEICPLPSKGWVHAIRVALGLNMRQLGQRLHISQQAISQLEAKEIDGSVTLKTMQKAAQALGCQFVYALVPCEGTLEDMVHQQALRKAEKLVQAVDRSMQLEAQGVGENTSKIQELAEEWTKHPKASLWEE